jgi:hypothetical protein
VRVFLILAVIAAACARAPKAREVDHDRIRVTADARLRTDAIANEGTATFVLVEAENGSSEAAYVSLGGELTDKAGATVGALRQQTLWIPAGELRTFALIDRDGKARPDAAGARILVKGARIGPPPPLAVDGFRQLTDGDKTVVQAVVKNLAAKGGDVIVLATFWGADGRPMTRPFSKVWIEANGSQPMQFVGPPGSTRGTIFIGDTLY